MTATRARAAAVSIRSNMRAPAALILIAGLLNVSCTDVALQPSPAAPVREYDNLLRIKGEYCTQPNGQITFPVKVMIILDQSTSLQCTDVRNNRFPALQTLVSDILSASPANQIGIVGFATWSRWQDFTRDPALLQPFLGPGALGPGTDYQGALATALRLLEQDMLRVGVAERARTRYVVLFASDGVPAPKCNAGCEDDQMRCANRMDDDGDGMIDAADSDCANIGDIIMHPDNLYAVCNVDPDVFQMVRMMTTMTSGSGGSVEYSDFQGTCPRYNQPEQIAQRVQQIIGLRDVYSVGDVVMHSVFIFAPQADVDAACGGSGAMFGFEERDARNVMAAIARAGGGVFRDVNTSNTNERFFDFDFRALEAQQVLGSFTAVNSHARVRQASIGPDSDFDGLSDEEEIALGLNASFEESDRDASQAPTGDGYGDLLETRLRARGFDPTNAAVPVVPCTERTDLDKDGLRDCEEAVLGTNPRLQDTDGDQMLDFFELREGTDPLRNDADIDSDFDGISNRDELAGGSLPLSPDAESYRLNRTYYDLADIGRRTIGGSTRSCQAFEARGIRLIPTPNAQGAAGSDPGLNRVLLYAEEAPAQVAGAEHAVYVACFEAYYNGPTDKVPKSGAIDLSGPAWAGIRMQLQQRMRALNACPWFTGAVTRANVENRILACMPNRIALDGFAFTQQRANALLQKYLNNDGSSRLPVDPAELFVPIETFDPAQHCHRPWELDRIYELFDSILSTCAACGTAGPRLDAGVRDAGASTFRSPCCM